ncbi:MULTISPECIES: ABC transporter permease [Paenibacillus]|uniref:ABC transporter permease n=1 Tax=Paenibacillus TaxID=44249 RepID=UPI0028115D15|nr:MULTISPECIES: ABC transporter permease [unclassified Paenibacillus]
MIVIHSPPNPCKGAFFGDIEREHKEKMKIAALVLSQGIEKPPSTPRSRPLLFRRSGRLFHRRTPGTGVAEAALKAFVRSGPRMKLYVQFVVLVMYAVAIVPSWLKWLLWGVVAFLLASWLRISGQELLDSRSPAVPVGGRGFVRRHEPCGIYAAAPGNLSHERCSRLHCMA